MSTCSSDSDEFYDAEDITPNRIPRRHRERDESRAAAAAAAAPAEAAVPEPQESTPEGQGSQHTLAPVLGVELSQHIQRPSLEIPVVRVEQHQDHEEHFEDGSTELAGGSVDDGVESKNDIKMAELEKRKRRMEELRKRMQTEEEESTVPSPPDSQTSSVDGVFAATRASHPFRIIEHDALSLQSTISLGRVGRILGGAEGPARIHSEPGAAASSASKESGEKSTKSESAIGEEDEEEQVEAKREGGEGDEEVLQEPDVVASTKAKGVEATTAPGELKVPVAPPRRKRKPKIKPPSEANAEIKEASCVTDVAPELPSPASTIESLTREFEHSLDIRLATKGQYVVKPQDEDTTKAEGRLASLPEVDQTPSLPSSQEPSPSPSSSQSGSVVGGVGGGGVAVVLSKEVQDGSRKTSPNSSICRLAAQLSSLPGVSQDESSLVETLNMVVRTRTDSGKELTDLEILEQVTVLNLDTGERVPLSIAEDKLPKCINPLSLHIMRLTSEYISNSSLDKEKESDEESVDSKKGSAASSEGDGGVVKKKTSQLKRFLGVTMKKTMDKAKSIAQEVSHARHKDEGLDIADDNPGTEHYLKVKASSSHKGPYEFDTLQFIQDLSGEHSSPIWCMKFSACGRLLATAGQDRLLRIWVLRDAFSYFQDMRTKYNAEKVSPTPSQESLVSQHSTEDALAHSASEQEREEDVVAPFMPKPFCIYSGHTSDLLDVSWSKNYFILSSSMDKTVRLWHISRKECLCCFQHIDFVTAIAFHPRDDRYFLSGSLDGKLRLWNIPDKKVALWNELDGQTKLITAANFCQNGKFAVVGSYDGRCIFYNTDQLKYHTQIHVRSTRGKNAKGRKISGIEPMPGEDKVLVTSNDSRIRLYDLRDLNLSCKYKGCANVSSQIRASFSHDGKYIISGSENQCIYIWRTHHDYAKFTSARRDRNDYWEGIKAHNAVVTCAVFAPNPDLIIKHVERERQKTEDPLLPPQTSGCSGYVIVSADFNGCIKVFLNKVKPKHSSLPASAMA